MCNGEKKEETIEHVEVANGLGRRFQRKWTWVDVTSRMLGGEKLKRKPAIAVQSLIQRNILFHSVVFRIDKQNSIGSKVNLFHGSLTLRY
ncbi:hypothetical protein J6590_020430 [Homalodisca vitripennis]|nr:hypothetical protein J6590_020430 [Homalodisca vitripennis]